METLGPIKGASRDRVIRHPVSTCILEGSGGLSKQVHSNPYNLNL